MAKVKDQRAVKVYDENGNISSKNSFDKRIFGGTFFNLVIPGI